MFWNDATSNSAGTGILIALPDYKIWQNYQCGYGRLQILSIEINSKKFLIINLYNHNNENEQVDLLVSLNDALAHFGMIDDHTFVISGDFNFIYDTSLDARGGNPTLKLRSLAQITKICDKYDLCDIFRIRHPDSKRFTFRTKNWKIHRRVDHFLVSNIAQETVHAVCILPSVRSDHSPILLSIINWFCKTRCKEEKTNQKKYWKEI